jgi:hypothetical protein
LRERRVEYRIVKGMRERGREEMMRNYAGWDGRRFVGMKDRRMLSVGFGISREVIGSLGFSKYSLKSRSLFLLLEYKKAK